MNARVTDYDRDCMRQLRISVEPDLRTQQQAEERLLIPEWIRRAQWRHFWEEQDAAYALMERERFRSIEAVTNSAIVTSLDALAFPTAKHEFNDVFRNRQRYTRPRHVEIDAIAVLIAVVIILGTLLCLYLSS